MRASSLALVLVACERSGPVQAPPGRPPAVVEATATELRFGKPPLKFNRLDVTLHNPSPEPRWMVLPTTFPYTGRSDPAPGGDDGELTAFALSTHPQVFEVRGVSSHFQAVRLPGGGEITLRGVRIDAWWDDVPATVDLEVLIAREITVAGVPIASVFARDVGSESGVDVHADDGIADPRLITVWHPDGPDVPVAFDVESRAAWPVTVARP